MLKGKTALITGSTSGIGLGIAKALARTGANVVINGLGNADEIEKTLKSIETDYSVKAIYDPADMTKPDQIEAMFAVWGRSDLLADPRFATHGARVDNYAALKGWLTEYLLERKGAELEAELTGAGVPAARLREIGETLSEPHMAARGLVQEAMLPGRDQPLGVLGPGFAVDAPDETPRVPVLGEDTDVVLGELGYDAEAITAFRAEKAI